MTCYVDKAVTVLLAVHNFYYMKDVYENSKTVIGCQELAGGRMKSHCLLDGILTWENEKAVGLDVVTLIRQCECS